MLTSILIPFPQIFKFIILLTRLNTSTKREIISLDVQFLAFVAKYLNRRN